MCSSSEFLHSKVYSRVDNNDKVPAIIDLEKDPVTGARLYNSHDCRELYFDDNEILDKLTGRNRFDKNNPNPSHSCWEEVLKATKSTSRPNGVKGSTKLIQQ